jgi:hypothetical protein
MSHPHPEFTPAGTVKSVDASANTLTFTAPGTDPCDQI